MKNLKAFTLAEVLTTLMIIGVIAAVTVPTLNQNIQSNEFVTGVLKADSALSQAVNRMKLDYGPIGLGSKWNNEDEIWNGFVKQLNTVKVCPKNNNDDCFIPASKAKGLNKSASGHSNKPYALVTADGMSYTFARGSCLSQYGLSEEDFKNHIGRFIVDVNGLKGPNVFGRDIYWFSLVKGKGIVPAGSANTDNCKLSSTGESCAAKVIKEKRIKYSK